MCRFRFPFYESKTQFSSQSLIFREDQVTNLNGFFAVSMKDELKQQEGIFRSFKSIEKDAKISLQVNGSSD